MTPADSIVTQVWQAIDELEFQIPARRCSPRLGMALDLLQACQLMSIIQPAYLLLLIIVGLS